MSAQLAKLTDLRLLRPSPHRVGDLLPSSPESAIADLINPIEIEIKGRERRAAELRFELTALSSVYYDNRHVRNRREAIDVVANVEPVRTLIGDVARRCSIEVFSAHPGILSDAAMAQSQTQDLELLGRGVRMRAIYQHPVRVNATMRAFLGRLRDAGCEIRTADEIADRIRAPADHPGGQLPVGRTAAGRADHDGGVPGRHRHGRRAHAAGPAVTRAAGPVPVSPGTGVRKPSVPGRGGRDEKRADSERRRHRPILAGE
ncbi:hypothetical protein [Paractinoplanes maris]|uniref:hypothetical protein n=1 Tax=Paractinoplanes maris TaxID=1734446 RepID=UPI002022829A|nr:hypothetical protein [Actinoplanes maris]